MMSFGVWVTTLFFLFLGLTFATLNLVFTLVNVAHSPVRYRSHTESKRERKGCCYITVDSATTALQNSACTYRCISIQMHYKTPFSHSGFMKSLVRGFIFHNHKNGTLNLLFPFLNFIYLRYGSEVWLILFEIQSKSH
jgi:hypothetical protein